MSKKRRFLIIDNLEVKKCSKCNKELPKTKEFFFRNKMGKDGFESQCKECIKKRRRRRYKPIIYKITNIVNDKVYIGQTIKPLTERVSKHFSDAKRGREQSLYENIRKDNYDRHLYHCEVLELVEKEELLDERERYWIKCYLDNGIQLYNVELGGIRNVRVPQSTRLKQAKTRGTKPFVVYDINKNFIGEFEMVSQANKLLNVNGLGMVLNGKRYHSKNYIAFYKDEFSENKLDYYIHKTYNPNKANHTQRNNENYKGSKNGMYGVRGKDNPNSKKVYTIKNNEILLVCDSCIELEEKLGVSNLRNYARGICNHYYKKMDIHIYYEDLLPEEYKYVLKHNYKIYKQNTKEDSMKKFYGVIDDPQIIRNATTKSKYDELYNDFIDENTGLKSIELNVLKKFVDYIKNRD